MFAKLASMAKALVAGLGAFGVGFDWSALANVDWNNFASVFVSQGWKAALWGLVVGFVTYHVPNTPVAK